MCPKRFYRDEAVQSLVQQGLSCLHPKRDFEAVPAFSVRLSGAHDRLLFANALGVLSSDGRRRHLPISY